MLASGACAVGLVTVVWLLSIALRDVSIIDVAWGLGFVAIGWVCFAVGHGSHDRRLLLAVLVTRPMIAPALRTGSLPSATARGSSSVIARRVRVGSASASEPMKLLSALMQKPRPASSGVSSGVMSAAHAR